jgi:hypothetical protein
MGLLALRPGDSLTILLDGFVNRLQDFQFPSFLPFKLRGLDSYPGGTCSHRSCQPSLDAHLSVLMQVVGSDGLLPSCRAALKSENFVNVVGLLHLNRIRAQAPCT